MFGEISGSLADLSDDDRKRLAEYCEAKEEYLRHMFTINGLRKVAALDPSEHNLKQLEDYSSVIAAPARREHGRLQMELLQSAVHVEQMKVMLPMLVTALLQSVNIPLLVHTFGLDPDQIDEAVDRVKEFLKSGME